MKEWSEACLEQIILSSCTEDDRTANRAVWYGKKMKLPGHNAQDESPKGMFVNCSLSYILYYKLGMKQIRYPVSSSDRYQQKILDQISGKIKKDIYNL